MVRVEEVDLLPDLVHRPFECAASVYVVTEVEMVLSNCPATKMTMFTFELKMKFQTHLSRVIRPSSNSPQAHHFSLRHGCWLLATCVVGMAVNNELRRFVTSRHTRGFVRSDGSR